MFNEYFSDSDLMCDHVYVWGKCSIFVCDIFEDILCSDENSSGHF